MTEPILRADQVTFAYEDRRVLREVSLSLQPGQAAALIGPNGSGKTTLLRVLTGVLVPQSGAAYLSGRRVDSLSRREVAAEVALVPQSMSVPFAFRVEEVVMLGRTPYVGAWRGPAAEDWAAVAAAMRQTGTEHLAGRVFNELSGGERQRVVLALALAQRPRVLLLDEPTLHLDVCHQEAVLDLVVRLARSGTAVLAVLHDLNMAALYFRRIVLLDNGRLAGDGSPSTVLGPRLSAVYGARLELIAHPTASVPQVLMAGPEQHASVSAAAQQDGRNGAQ
jgi:iron complex transport system ATP-binding protein